MGRVLGLACQPRTNDTHISDEYIRLVMFSPQSLKQSQSLRNWVVFSQIHWKLLQSDSVQVFMEYGQNPICHLRTYVFDIKLFSFYELDYISHRILILGNPKINWPLKWN